MFKQIKGLLYFYRTDLHFSILVFWSILFVMLAVSVTMMHMFPSIVMTFSFTAPIYVFCAIIGFLMARHTIAFGIKLGATRKNIYISMGIFFVALAFVKSAFAAVVQEGVLRFLIRDDMSFWFMHIVYFGEDTLFTRFYTDFFIILFLTSISFLISLLFYKYGMLISGLIVGMLFVLLTYSLLSGELITIVGNSFQNSMYIFFAQLGLIALIAYGVCWALMRNVTVVPKK